MKKLEIDIETYSSESLAKCGVYKYAESDDFEILLFGYSVDGGEIKVVELVNGETLPDEIRAALLDDGVEKWAHNASFERICISRYLGFDKGKYLDPKSWKCSMVWCAYRGLPLSLEAAGSALGLEKQKISEGRDLIRYFCVPCRPTKSNGQRTRNMPNHDMEKWNNFVSYNIRDVEVEMSVQEKLQEHPVPDFIWDEYHLCENINDRGIKVDTRFVDMALSLNDDSHGKIESKMREITGLSNPGSVVQMKGWLEDKGIEVETLGKKSVSNMLKTTDGETNEALNLRLKLAKSSVKKYEAMKNAACSDGRCRGMFQFYGANRTGRFAGRIVQLQNLPQNHMEDLAEARELVGSGNFDLMEMLYDDIPDTLSQLIRTAFIPSENMSFYVADFSAIEARVIAWLAGESWRLDVFRDGGDIYCASASQMFGIPVEKHGINGHLRQKGKIAELALGYGGSVGALKAMGALEMGLEEEELKPLVNAWRASNKKIERLWWEIDSAVKNVIITKEAEWVGGINIYYKNPALFIGLPSGRSLAYVKPRLEPNKHGSKSVKYYGVDGSRKWGLIESYGPKFVENIVQAIARDLLVNAMQNLSQFRIVAHVHDELIIEAPDDTSLDALCEEMAKTPTWASGLELRADGYKCKFYKKD